MNPNNLKDIVRAGIIRFRNEGFYRWKKKDVEALICSKDYCNKISDPHIVQLFLDLEKEGLIFLKGLDDVFLEVNNEKIANGSD